MSDEWVGRDPDIKSPYYPFRKAIDANTIAGVERLPYVLTKYLMDMPLPGYTPPSDNRFPRARLKKLLYWDDALPLDKPLPTPAQMLSIQFDPYRPGTAADAERGYRIYQQELVQQAQAVAKTILRVYLGSLNRVQEKNEFIFRQTVIYTVMCHYDLEANLGMAANSRSYAIVQAIIEATEGVNFGGIGGMVTHQITKFDDERTNTGYKIYQTIDWHGSGINPAY